MCGDINARIGTVEDFIDNNHLEVNAYGKSLIDLCIGNNLITLNGRTNGDLLGQFTCHTYNGASVVDYVIVSHDLLASVVGFRVDDITEYSHHSCLSFILESQYTRNSNDSIKLTPHNKSFVWDDSLKDTLRESMRSNVVLNKLESLFLRHNIMVYPVMKQQTLTHSLKISQKFCPTHHKRF